MKQASLSLLLLVSASLIAVVALFFLPKKGLPVSDMRDVNGTVSIVLRDTGFDPQSVRIRRGTTVVFSTTRSNQFWPASNPHPTHDIYPKFDARVPISPDSTWSFRFDDIGTWNYHDHIRSYFTGTVYVE